MTAFSLEQHGILVGNVLRNASPAALYEAALRSERGTTISSSGALIAMSGGKTGRSPVDKRIVEEEESKNDIGWGKVNIALDVHTFEINRTRAIDYLNTKEQLYAVDGFAGWDPKYRIKVRVICARAYHALFMHNMLLRPTAAELETFGEPDYVIFNSGQFPANRHTTGMSSTTSVDLSLKQRELVILGTEYAGEMKKGVFTIMNYLMPRRGVLSMHCSATEGKSGDSSILFGLSGTGKTTLSADPNRLLIGDDEHCWTDEGLFNIEGGCYAKTAGLTEEAEPEIFRAIRFGTVLENVVSDPKSHVVDFTDTSLTKNTRAAYPIEYIPSVKLPCITSHPKNVIFLTCDAFGVLPPVSRLSTEQAMYHFLSGYTAKVSGTEMGVTDPEATFSPCFGGPFLVWNPTKYAELLAARLEQHRATAWLVNTGWSGGAYGTGKRIDLRFTRAIIDAIHGGSLSSAPSEQESIFGLEIPTICLGVPSQLLNPRRTWANPEDFEQAAKKLATLFQDNFRQYEAHASAAVAGAGPKP